MKLSGKSVKRLFGMMWIIYFCSYLGRLNYSAAMGELIGDQFTRSQAGWVSTAFLISYAAGQLINGVLSEQVNPVRLLFIGTLTAGLMNLTFPFANAFLLLLANRFLTGFAMSMLWPSILVLMVRSMNREDQANYSVHIASSMSLGTLASYLMTSFELKWIGWQSAFVTPGIMLIMLGIIWLFIAPRLLEGVDVQRSRLKRPNQTQANLKSYILLMPCVIAALIPVILHGVIKDGVTAWVPTYIMDVFHKDASFAAFVSICLPLCNLSGAYIARFAHRKTGGKVFPGSAVFFFVAAAMLTLMATVGQSVLLITLLSFAILTSSMMAVNVLLINLLPLRYERYGQSGTISGGLNALAYAGSALASGAIGIITDQYGWSASVISWLVLMAIAVVLCIGFMRVEDRERIRESQ